MPVVLAEDLPLRNNATDIVVFFNSLHHVEKGGLSKALREAARVLKPGGILFVSEPMAEGPYFELMKPAHDETAVRGQAQDVLRHAPEFGLLQEHVLTHVDSVKFADFEGFHDRITSINPETREHFRENEDTIRDSFERLEHQPAPGTAMSG